MPLTPHFSVGLGAFFVAGRAANRRTRIVILPQLDQFFKLLEPQKE